MRRRDSWWALAVGGIALVVFVLTLAPTVTSEDSGELISAAWHFGVPHPPGYPLWTMLCGVFMHILPFGEEAWRANLFSALGSAAAASVTFLALRLRSLSPWACAAAALAWVLGRWSWSQSVITEVYALNSLIVAGLLWCGLAWYVSRKRRYLLMASLLFGLGVSHHHVVGLAALALIIWILLLSPRLLLRWKLVIASLTLFAIGLTPYLYLPIRAAADPPLNWGRPIVETDPGVRFWDSSFIKHITRHQYGTVGPAKASEDRSFPRFGRQLAYVGEALADDITLWGIALAAGGVIVLALRERKILLLVLLWLICTGALFAAIANFDLDRTNRWVNRVFLVPTSLGLMIPVAFLMDQLIRRIQEKSPAGAVPQAVIGAVVAIQLPVVLAVHHWKSCNYRNYYFAEDHGRNLLSCMDERAIAFCSGDHNTFPVLYLQLVKGERTDVTPADPYGYPDESLFAEAGADASADSIAHFLAATDRPVYFTVKDAPPVAGWTFEPSGILYRVGPPGIKTNSYDKLQGCRYRNLDADMSPSSIVDLGASHILFDYFFFRGLAQLDAKSLEAALVEFDRGAQYVHGIREPFNNIGSALAEHGHTAEALTYFKQAAEIDSAYATPRRNMYLIYRNHGDNEQAWQMLMELRAADPNDARMLKDLGWYHYEINHDANAARRAWSESLQQNPYQPDIIQALNRLYQPAR